MWRIRSYSASKSISVPFLTSPENALGASLAQSGGLAILLADPRDGHPLALQRLRFHQLRNVLLCRAPLSRGHQKLTLILRTLDRNLRGRSRSPRQDRESLAQGTRHTLATAVRTADHDPFEGATNDMAAALRRRKGWLRDWALQKSNPAPGRETITRATQLTTLWAVTTAVGVLVWVDFLLGWNTIGNTKWHGQDLAFGLKYAWLFWFLELTVWLLSGIFFSLPDLLPFLKAIGRRVAKVMNSIMDPSDKKNTVTGQSTGEKAPHRPRRTIEELIEETRFGGYLVLACVLLNVAAMFVLVFQTEGAFESPFVPLLAAPPVFALFMAQGPGANLYIMVIGSAVLIGAADLQQKYHPAGAPSADYHRPSWIAFYLPVAALIIIPGMLQSQQIKRAAEAVIAPKKSANGQAGSDSAEPADS